MSPLVREYEVPGDDFARAGEASGHIKSMLKAERPRNWIILRFLMKWMKLVMSGFWMNSR